MNIKVKQLTSVLLSMVLLCLFNACSEEQEMEIATGGLQISLAEDWVDVTSSRATPAQLYKPLQEQFHLKVTKQDTKNVVHDGAFRSYFRTLTPGEYTLEATYGENKVLDWDAPYYAGSVTANVENGGSTQATIPVSVKNALMSVEFTNPEIFGQIYSQYGLEVKVPTSGGSQSLTIWSDITEKSAYLRAGLENVEVAFVGTTIEGNKKIKYSLTETLVEAETLPLQAADHAKITLTAANTGINVTKIEVENVTVEETVPLEWLPIPKFKTATGFSDKTMTFVETERKEAKINYALASPLQDAKIVFNFDAPQYPELTALNGSYVLTTITNEQRTALQNMGITLPFVGSTNCQVDLTGVTERMQTNNGTSTTNTVTINVKANNRWSNGDKVQGTGDVFTMKVNKPDMSIQVQPGNVWSKEFTIDEVSINSGNPQTILSNLKYQYRANGDTEWQDCIDNGRIKKFNEHPTTKNYEVRAIYRGTIASNEADVTLETPTQIPNSDMESWHTVKGENFRPSDSWLSSKKQSYLFYPYASGESDIWWATNNQRSQDGTIALGLGHPTCFAPCVSYNENIKHGGKRSTLIYTSGHGGGSTSTGEIIYPNEGAIKGEGAIAGNLFIGSYQWSDATETIKTGHSFPVRPTDMKFWYRYSPKSSDNNNDQFKVYIELRNGNEAIANGQYIPTAYSTADSEFKEASIKLNYTSTMQKATSIYVQFLSTTKTSFNKDDFNRNKSITFPQMGDWNVHIGSMLYIDDISLIYDK